MKFKKHVILCVWPLGASVIKLYASKNKLLFNIMIETITVCLSDKLDVTLMNKRLQL